MPVNEDVRNRRSSTSKLKQGTEYSNRSIELQHWFDQPNSVERSRCSSCSLDLAKP